MNKLTVNEKLEVLIGTKEDLIASTRIDGRRLTRAEEAVYSRFPCTSYWKNGMFHILVDSSEKSITEMRDLFYREYVLNCWQPKEDFEKTWVKCLFLG